MYHSTACKMPTYFPSTNCRRLIGFESSVIAVLFSISSATLELAVQTAISNPEIKIVANEENPGYYSATFNLRPHYQLEGMDIGLRLVSRIDKRDA